jgi:RNA polymerase sigma-70 factor (ECF subfamily)
VSERPTDSLDPATQAALLERVARAGDRAAFGALHGHFAPRVKAYLLRRGAGAAADDLTQEAMVRLWRAAGRYDPAQASVAAWLFAIARNLWIDALRRDLRPALDSDEPGLVPEAPLAPDAAAFQADRTKRLKAALRGLPTEQREIVELCYFAELSQSQAADALGIPLGTVKGRVRLALARLRAELEHVR